MPKCENLHEKPKWLSILVCVLHFLTKISFYLRGNVSATIECLCDDYSNRVLAPQRREIHLRMSNIYTAVQQAFQMTVSLSRYTSVSVFLYDYYSEVFSYSYKYLMMCHSAVIAHTTVCLSIYPGFIALEIYKYYQIFQINTQTYLFICIVLLFAFKNQTDVAVCFIFSIAAVWFNFQISLVETFH